MGDQLLAETNADGSHQDASPDSGANGAGAAVRNPTIELTTTDGRQVPLVTREMPFVARVVLPGDGNAPAILKIHFKSSHGTRDLSIAYRGRTARGYVYESEPITLAEGAEGGDSIRILPGTSARLEFSTGGMSRLSTDNGEIIDISYGDGSEPEASAKLQTYDTPLDATIAASDARIAAWDAFVRNILIGLRKQPDAPAVRRLREWAEARFKLLEQAHQDIARTPGKLERAHYTAAWAGVIESFDPGVDDARTMVPQALHRAQEQIQETYHRAFDSFAVNLTLGIYQLFIGSLPLVAPLWTVFTRTDIFGRKVEGWEVVMNVLDAAGQAALLALPVAVQKEFSVGRTTPRLKADEPIPRPVDPGARTPTLAQVGERTQVASDAWAPARSVPREATARDSLHNPSGDQHLVIDVSDIRADGYPPRSVAELKQRYGLKAGSPYEIDGDELRRLLPEGSDERARFDRDFGVDVPRGAEFVDHVERWTRGVHPLPQEEAFWADLEAGQRELLGARAEGIAVDDVIDGITHRRGVDVRGDLEAQLRGLPRARRLQVKAEVDRAVRQLFSRRTGEHGDLFEVHRDSTQTRRAAVLEVRRGEPYFGPDGREITPTQNLPVRFDEHGNPIPYGYVDVPAPNANQELAVQAFVRGQAALRDSSVAADPRYRQIVERARAAYDDPRSGFRETLERGYVRAEDADGTRTFQRVARPEEQAVVRHIIGRSTAADEAIVERLRHTAPRRLTGIEEQIRWRLGRVVSTGIDPAETRWTSLPDEKTPAHPAAPVLPHPRVRKGEDRVRPQAPHADTPAPAVPAEDRDLYFNPETGHIGRAQPGTSPPPEWRKLQPIPPTPTAPGGMGYWYSPPRLWVDPDTGESRWIFEGEDPPAGWKPVAGNELVQPPTIPLPDELFFDPRTGHIGRVPGGTPPPPGWKMLQPIAPMPSAPGGLGSWYSPPQLYVDPDTGESRWIYEGEHAPVGWKPVDGRELVQPPRADAHPGASAAPRPTRPEHRPRRGRKWTGTAAKAIGVLGSLAAAGGLAYGVLHHNGKSAFATHYPAADRQVQQVEGNLLGSLAGSSSGHPLTPSMVDAAASQVSAADRRVGAVPAPRELADSVSQLRSSLAQQHQELKQLSVALKQHHVGVANRKHVALLGQALNVSGAANQVAAAAGLPPASGPASSTIPAAGPGETAAGSSGGAPVAPSPAQGGIAASTSQTEALPPVSSGSTAGVQYLGVKVQLVNQTTTPRLVLPTSIPSLVTSAGRAVQPALTYTDAACSASSSAALTGVILAPGQQLTTCVPFQLAAGEQPQRFGYQLDSIAAAESPARSPENAPKGISPPAPAGAGG